MAREGTPSWRPKKSAAERNAARQAAKGAADRAVLKLQQETAVLIREYTGLKEAVALLVGDAEVGDRVVALIPALSARLAGRVPGHTDQLRRNVALRAEVPAGEEVARASAQQLRKWQHGSRLEVRHPSHREQCQEVVPDSARAAPDRPVVVDEDKPAVQVAGREDPCTTCSPRQEVRGTAVLEGQVGVSRLTRGELFSRLRSAAVHPVSVAVLPPSVIVASVLERFREQLYAAKWLSLDTSCEFGHAKGMLCTCGAALFSGLSCVRIPRLQEPLSGAEIDSCRGRSSSSISPPLSSRMPLLQDADVEAKLVADVVVGVSEEALAGRLGALVEGAEPAVELKGDLAALPVRQGAFEESAEAKCELEVLSQRPCALGAASEQLVSQEGDLAALSEQRGALAEGAEPMGEREVLSEPLNALEALCEQREAKMASRRACSESLFYFLDDFTVAAMMCVAIGPKSGVESLLSSAEARFIDVSPGSVGWPDAEERERILEGRLQVVQMPRGVRDGSKSSASWRAWAKEAEQKGGRHARWFARAAPPPQVVDPDTGSLFLDIAKFYGNLRHDVLWRCGVEHGINLRVLRGLLVLYQSPRFICLVGLATESFSTKGARLAGCVCATTVAKLPVLGALRAASAGGIPLVVARNVADDIALQAVGTERLVASQLGSAGLKVARILRDQHLPLSAAKTTFLASSPSLGRQLGEYWKSQGWAFRETLQARNLGTDAVITRRGVHEGRVRAAGALRRARRLGCLRAAGVEVDLIHKAGPTASMAWGRAVTGNADGELHRPRMRCAELRRRRDLDPAVLTAGHSVQMLAGLLQSGELPLRMMARGLEAAATRRASADTPWKHCASPIDAVVLTLARIGWHFKSELCLVTDLGEKLDLTLLGPRELGFEAGRGARRASDRHEMRKLSHDPLLQRPLCWGAIGQLLGPGSELSVREQNALGAYISNTHWTKARLFDAGSCAERARALGECADENFARCWLPAPEPPQGRRADAMSVWWIRRPADDELNGALYLDGSALEPQFGALRRAGWAIAQCDDDGNLVAGVRGSVMRDLCLQQTAKDGGDFAVWMLANYAGPAVEKVNIDSSATVACLRRGRACAAAPSRSNVHLWSRILAAFEPGVFAVGKVPAHCSRQAVLDGLLAEAQRRGNERADRLAKMGAQLHAVDRQTVGEHHALAEIVRELGRWICQAAIIWQGIAAEDCEGLPPAAERRQVRFAAAEAPQVAGEAADDGARAKRPRLESARSTGSISAALSASAVAFSIPGHALSYACAGEGEGTQEIAACSKCGAYMVLGGRSGVKPRLKERCTGDKTDKSGRNQRSLWSRGLHPGGRPRAAKQRAKGEGPHALRSQGPVPGHAQERCLEWLGVAAEPAAGASTAASSAGSAPAAAAAPGAATEGQGEPPTAERAAAAAASQPQQRPTTARAGLLGAHGITEEEISAAASTAVDAQESRRVRRRLARRGAPSESSGSRGYRLAIWQSGYLREDGGGKWACVVGFECKATSSSERRTMYDGRWLWREGRGRPPHAVRAAREAAQPRLSPRRRRARGPAKFQHRRT
ncbi:unnamed protein product, partial [Prorocentrum cordatum]